MVWPEGGKVAARTGGGPSLVCVSKIQRWLLNAYKRIGTATSFIKKVINLQSNIVKKIELSRDVFP